MGIIDERLHVIIEDSKEDVYQVPESVFPRPESEENDSASAKSALKFSMTQKPFSFKVTRRATDEVIFDTSNSPLIFESQYLRLRTSLPDEPSLYGLGEHSDPLRLQTEDLVTTLWNRDAFGIPPGTNLYGSHPVYYDHRGRSGTHGVFLLNSNGMDVKVGSEDGDNGKKYLEYNTLGGVLDFYFMAGPTPKEVASQYAEVVGLPAMMPYWGFGVRLSRPYRSSPLTYMEISMLIESSFINAGMATGTLLMLPRWSTTIARLVSPWKLCGRISTTWTDAKSSHWTRSASP